jgi:uncharacterized protein GlcG (DUF336 family)
MSPALGPAPEAWQAGKLIYGSGLTLKTAKKMLEAGENESLKQNVPMVIAIADSGGNLLAFERMDNAMLCSVQIALDKAYTAVFGKMHTGELGGSYRSGNLIPLFFHERWITFPGGFPIVKDGVVLGGLGVSGGVVEDLYVAEAALKAGGFSIAEVEKVIAQNEASRKAQ